MTKFERIQKTVNLAKERARKTSVTLLGTGAGHPGGRKESTVAPPSPNISSIQEENEEEDVVQHGKLANQKSNEVETNLRARMQKTDSLMR